MIRVGTRKPARRLYARMVQCRLHQADRCVTVKGMARMRMAQPVGRDLHRQACSVCGGLHAVEGLCGQEWPTRMHGVYVGALVRTEGMRDPARRP